MPSLSEADRRSLLDLARRSITNAISGQKPTGSVPGSGVFVQKQGVFVTLHARGRLRGCIGIVEAYEPISDAISHCAVSAASQDPRFSPVRAEEIPELKIEISLLSAPEAILPQNVEIGKHGLIISHGGHRGLLLPQVAMEHKLSREQFLDETCLKAGLPAKAWQQGETQILGFTCEVFSEDDLA
jgi:uncharacterized protein